MSYIISICLPERVVRILDVEVALQRQYNPEIRVSRSSIIRDAVSRLVPDTNVQRVSHGGRK
jgi:Arc/MetJ-type ribon-helix-helix transcriptional regulator